MIWDSRPLNWAGLIVVGTTTCFPPQRKAEKQFQPPPLSDSVVPKDQLRPERGTRLERRQSAEPPGQLEPPRSKSVALMHKLSSRAASSLKPLKHDFLSTNFPAYAVCDAG